MKVVVGLIILRCLVTLQTDSVTGFPQCQAMRLMAITAGDTGVKHLALHEGTVDIDFIVHLAIGKILHTLIQKSRQIMSFRSSS
jgi:hypothetical protein